MGRPTFQALGVQILESPNLQEPPPNVTTAYLRTPDLPNQNASGKRFATAERFNLLGALPLYLTLSLISSCVLSNTAGNTVLLVRYQKDSLTLTLSLQLFVTGHQSINIT